MSHDAIIDVPIAGFIFLKEEGEKRLNLKCLGLVVVVCYERVEGDGLHPSHTQLLGGVACKAIDIRLHEWHPEQTKQQHNWRVRWIQSVSPIPSSDLWSVQKNLFDGRG